VWDSTTVVLVEASAGEIKGLGFTYASRSTGMLIQEKLRSVVVGLDVLDIQNAWVAMTESVRNLARPGISSMAIAAVDIALWDLKARLLQLPLVKLLGQVRPTISAYGSGGFTSYSVERLQEQLRGWVELGLHSVKMKIGREPKSDTARVRAAREAADQAIELFVDANGAYSPKQALETACPFQGLVNLQWSSARVRFRDDEHPRRGLGRD